MKQQSDPGPQPVHPNPGHPHIPEELKIHLRNLQQQTGPGFHGPVHGPGFPDFHSADKNQRIDSRSPHGLPPPGSVQQRYKFEMIWFTFQAFRHDIGRPSL